MKTSLASFFLRLALLSLPAVTTASAASTPRNGAISASAIVDIQQTLALFPILLDGGRLDELHQVFTRNVTADLGVPGFTNLTGLDMLIASLAHFRNLSSQHAYTTQYVNLTGINSATATTYFNGFFFGKGNFSGQVFTNYGVYVLPPRLM